MLQGFREMQENKQQIVGSSTACLMMLCHSDLKLYTANIGDSGFLVVRCGEVVHRSQEQQHYFNTPFQLSLPPTELQSEVSSLWSHGLLSSIRLVSILVVQSLQPLICIFWAAQCTLKQNFMLSSSLLM